MRPQGVQPLDSAVIPRFAEPATFMRTPYVQIAHVCRIAAGMPPPSPMDARRVH
jgi:hypothetical protein